MLSGLLTPDSTALMQTIVRHALVATCADGCVVELEEDEALVCVAAAGRVPVSPGARSTRGGSLAALASRAGILLSCEDAESDERVDRLACRRAGVRSMLCMPIPAMCGTGGVLTASSAQPGRFDERAREAIVGVAELLEAVVLEPARKSSELTDRSSRQVAEHSRARARGLPDGALARRQRALHLIATRVAGGADPTESLNLLAESVGELFDADDARVLQFDPSNPDRATVVGTCTRSESGPGIGAEVALHDAPPLERLRVTGQAVHATSALRAFPGLVEHALAPIRVHNSVWGALFLGVGEPKALPSDAVAQLAAVTDVVDLAVTATQARSVATERLQRLEELDQLKNDFIALISHELRTPLNSIVGYLELLGEDADLIGEPEQFLAIARRNADRLKEMVDQLLTLFQLDAGPVQTALERVAVHDVLRESLETIKPAAKCAGVAVTLATDDAWARASAQGLAQIADNLLTNAIKYTPSGGSVTVRARTAANTVFITVEDTGIGIPPDEVERLFDRFFRASTAAEAQIPGTGLGLAVTRALVQSFGGQIEVTSAPGAGTKFTVTLPGWGS